MRVFFFATIIFLLRMELIVDWEYYILWEIQILLWVLLGELSWN
jgi:hypothetical protein